MGRAGHERPARCTSTCSGWGSPTYPNPTRTDDTTIISGPGLRQIFSHRDQGSGMMFELIERLGGDFSDQSVQQLFQQLEQKDAF
ncbi:MAG TPA: hypothetical protein VHQ90_11155 [Thermoanaerobaculia bacterium]|nr:hypothetical protein [Thermoanaerobaculia bacterium]